MNNYNLIECPSCAVEIPAAEVCPICGYEFPRRKNSLKWIVLIVVAAMLLPLLKIVWNLCAGR